MHIRTKHIPVWSREAKSQQANINTAFYAWATNRCNTQSCQNEESNTASSSQKKNARTSSSQLLFHNCALSENLGVFTQNPQVFLIIFSSKMAMTRWDVAKMFSRATGHRCSVSAPGWGRDWSKNAWGMGIQISFEGKNIHAEIKRCTHPPPMAQWTHST